MKLLLVILLFSVAICLLSCQKSRIDVTFELEHQLRVAESGNCPDISKLNDSGYYEAERIGTNIAILYGKMGLASLLKQEGKDFRTAASEAIELDKQIKKDIEDFNSKH